MSLRSKIKSTNIDQANRNLLRINNESSVKSTHSKSKSVSFRLLIKLKTRRFNAFNLKWKSSSQKQSKILKQGFFLESMMKTKSWNKSKNFSQKTSNWWVKQIISMKTFNTKSEERTNSSISFHSSNSKSFLFTNCSKRMFETLTQTGLLTALKTYSVLS